LEEGFVEGGDGGGEEGGGVVRVDGGVEAVGDCWGDGGLVWEVLVWSRELGEGRVGGGGLGGVDSRSL
jgi:hypothetical protein